MRKAKQGHRELMEPDGRVQEYVVPGQDCHHQAVRTSLNTRCSWANLLHLPFFLSLYKEEILAKVILLVASMR